MSKISIQDYITAKAKLKELKKQIIEQECILESFDLTNYMMANSESTKPSECDFWDDVRFIAKLVQNGHSYSAWEKELNMDYAKEIAKKYDNNCLVFNNGLDEPLVFNRVGDTNDLRCTSIKNVDIENDIIHCEYIFGNCSNVSGKVLDTYTGEFKLTLSHVMDYFNNPSESENFIEDATFTPPLFY